MSTVDTPLALAKARLEASRQRLRRQFIPPAPPRRTLAGATGAPRPAWLQGLTSGPLRFLNQLLRRHPVGEAALDGVVHWWDRHPWRGTAEMVASEASNEWRRSGLPLLRRHPVASVAIAGLAGAALVVAKPWRSPRVTSRLRPLPRRLGSWAMAQIPLQTVLTGLVVMLASRDSGSDRDST